MNMKPFSTHNSPNNSTNSSVLSSMPYSMPTSELNQFIIGYAEKKISLETLAEIFRDQLFERNVSVDEYPLSTLAILCDAFSTFCDNKLDLVTAIATHSMFPGFLPNKVCLNLFFACVKQSSQLSLFSNQQKLSVFKTLVEKLAQNLLERRAKGFSQAEKARLNNFVKTLPETAKALCKTLPKFSSLFQVETFAAQPAQSLNDSSTEKEFDGFERYSENLNRERTSFAQQQKHGHHANVDFAHKSQTLFEIFEEMLSIPEVNLLSSGVSKWTPRLRNSKRETDRFESSTQVLKYLNEHARKVNNETSDSNGKHSEHSEKEISPAFVEFVSEWLFDGILADSCLVQSGDTKLKLFLELFAETISENYPVAYIAAVTAAQRELDLHNSSPHLAPAKEQLFSRAQNVVATFLACARKNAFFLSRNTLLQLSRIACASEATRLFTRSDFLWAKSILTGSWEEELKRIPLWVEMNSGSLIARIFQIAPNFWTHENGYLLAEKLQWELVTSNSSVETTQEQRKHQADFLSYLAKLLRTKSAFFNSKIELVVVSCLLASTASHNSSSANMANVPSTEEKALVEIARARLKITENSSVRKAIEMLDESLKQSASLGSQTTQSALAGSLQLIVNVLKESRGLSLKGTLKGGIVAT